MMKATIEEIEKSERRAKLQRDRTDRKRTLHDAELEKARTEYSRIKKSAEREKIRKDARIKARKELQAEQAKKHGIIEDTAECLKALPGEIINEEIKDKSDFESAVDPLMHLIPSRVYAKDLDAKEANKIDDDQFEQRMKRRFLPDMITDYIEEMLRFFDIKPYYEKAITKKVSANKGGGAMIEYITKPNDLPLFSKFGFSVGLTKEDIQYLRDEFPRFSHAYDMCKEMQEHILITNMLLGLYGNSVSMFSAKNLLGWRSEEKVDINGNLDIGSLINNVMNKTSKVDFMEDDITLKVLS